MDDIYRVRDNMVEIERDAQRTLTAQLRAAGDDTHYYRASLQHFADWLVVNGHANPGRDLTGEYLDAMGARDFPRKWMRRARRVLKIVRRENP